MRKILIGIQARSGSTRLPNKAFELINGVTMLDMVYGRCKDAAPHIERKTGFKTEIAVLTPKGDKIVGEFSRRMEVIEGPEFDVLGRYKIAVDLKNPDFIVRVTGDCPLLPPFVISSLVERAISRNYDYMSNSDERFRTSLDGSDCEVIGRKLFEHTAEQATRPEDREHVTTLIRRSPPVWASMGLAINHFDHSELKLSVDTAEDLERVRRAFESVTEKAMGATKFYGRGHVHHL